LSLLDCEDELLAIAGAMRIAYFVEASRAAVKGPYDLSLVVGDSDRSAAANACFRHIPACRNSAPPNPARHLRAALHCGARLTPATLRIFPLQVRNFTQHSQALRRWEMIFARHKHCP
jgi:hypothetical protein